MEVEGDKEEHLRTVVDNEDVKRTEKDIGDSEDSNNDEDNLGVSYPDTSIDFQYTSGGKFQFQRGTSTSSSQATEDFVDLGDGELLDLRSLGADSATRKQRLSAKQRRQMKKKVSPGGVDVIDAQEAITSRPGVELTKPQSDAGNYNKPTTQQTVAKRGKKSKLKKIKEKYGEQDEEDRELMMQMLGSAGTPKESKRKKGKDSKGRKGSAQNKQGDQRTAKDSNVKNKANPGMGGDTNNAASEISPAGEVLENFAGDLAQGLATEGVNDNTVETGIVISRAKGSSS